jgi:hypothetical protein
MPVARTAMGNKTIAQNIRAGLQTRLIVAAAGVTMLPFSKWVSQWTDCSNGKIALFFNGF